MASSLKVRARRVVELKDEHELARIEYEDAKRAHKDAERDLWHDLNEELGVKTVTLDLGEPHGTITIQRRETIKGRVLDPATAVSALRAAGLGEAVLKDEPSVRQKVLNEHVRDILKGDGKLPDGIDFVSTRFLTISRK